MISLKYRYEVEGIHQELVDSYQSQFSSLLITVYNHLDLMKSLPFVSSLKESHLLMNAKMIEHSATIATSMMKSWQSKQEVLVKEIANLNKELTDKTLKEREKEKMRKKLTRKERSLGKQVCFGSKLLLKKYNKQKNNDDILAEETLIEYRNKRKLGFQSIGDAGYDGSRHFDFSGFAEGIVVFKPCKGTKIPLELKMTSMRKRSKEYKQFIKAITMAEDKKLSISVIMKQDYIFFTYDNQVVEGNAFGVRAFNEKKKKCIDVQDYKDLLKEAHKEKESRMAKDKVAGRLMSIDINPERIGYTILDIDEKLGVKPVNSGCFEYKGLTKKYKLLYKSSDSKNHSKATNERNYWLSVIMAKIGRLAKHHKVESFAIEDLDLEREVYNRHTHGFNRLTNNMWNRTLIMKSINKFCSNYGFNLMKIPPEYSSVVGNLNHNAFDPISASAEIGRRAMNWIWIKKFGKETLPQSLQWNLPIERLCRLGDLKYVPSGTRNIGQLFRFLCTSGSSYRRPLMPQNMIGYVSFNKGRIIHWMSSNSLLNFY